MINIRVTTAEGLTWTTGFNGNFQEAQNYFMGQRFEKQNEELSGPVVKVELLD